MFLLSTRRKSMRRHGLVLGFLAACAMALLAAPAAFAGPLSLVSVSGRVQADGPTSTTAVADGGSEVAYITSAGNLDPLDKNGAPDVYVWSQETGRSVRVSVGGPTGGGAANGVADCRGCVAISPDGRFVTFVAKNPGFDEASDNGVYQVWLRDREQGTTTLVSADDEGRPGTGGDSGLAAEFVTQLALTPDAGSVVFTSSAGNLGGGEGLEAVYVRRARRRVERGRISQPQRSLRRLLVDRADLRGKPDAAGVPPRPGLRRQRRLRRA
jgi:hypothetical protein